MRVIGVLAAASLSALACGSEVVVFDSSSSTTSSGQGGGGAGGTPVGGAGGEDSGCSAECKSCCNDPRCPDEPPDLGDPCDITPENRLTCGYDAPNDCLTIFFCQDNGAGFSQLTNPFCPGECGTGIPTDGYPCPAPGETCQEDVDVGGEFRCYSFTCQDDYGYGPPTYVIGTCP